MAHWIAEFGTYDLDIQYRPGPEAIVPDAISRRPDFIGVGEAYQSQFASIRSVDEYDWEQAMILYLRTKEEPSDEKLRKAILEDKDHPPSSFVLEKDSLLYKKMDKGQVPYLPPIVRSVYLERTHKTYGHLGWPGLKDVLENRAWWPTIERDVQQQISKCPECQAAKGPRTGSERGPRHTLERTEIQLFDSWSIDFIGMLPRTFNGNRWIISAIERSTGWPVTAAVPDATSQTVMNFIHERIFTDYGIPHEILTDNGTNLVSEAVEDFLKPTKLKHRTTTPYHPQTNGKIERFNGTIGSMLTKYLYGKSVRLWDEYLAQATFAVRLRTHAVGKYSPFFLLYGVQPRLPEDPIRDVTDKSEARIETMLQRHIASNEARLSANGSLVKKALEAQLVREEKFKVLDPIPVGSYVLVRDESAKKFRPKWYGPYKVIMTAPVGTYALQDCHGQVIRSLIHGSRLLPLNDHIINQSTGKWKSSYLADRLRTERNVIEDIEESRAALEQDTIPGFTYKDLATIRPKEWIEMQSRGLDRSKLGEGKIGDISYEEHIFQKLRARVEAQERREEKEAQQEEAVDHDPVSTALPERVSHSIDRIVSVQAPISMATSQETPPAQVDVPMVEEPQGELPIEPGEREETLARKDTEVRLPAHTEAGRQESIIEDLQPLDDDPPPRRDTDRQQDTDRQRDTRTGYSLRRKPRKARSKDL